MHQAYTPFQVGISGQACHSTSQDRFREEEVVRPQGQETPVPSQRKQSKNIDGDEPGKIEAKRPSLFVVMP
jgi:hypothetical protein